MKILKTTLNRFLKKIGYQFVSVPDKYADLPVELDEFEVQAIRTIFDNDFTMVSILRLVNTLKACKHAVQNNIEGDFVECGVWRGGNGILAKMVFNHLNSNKKVWMFDTFMGMTEPSEVDVVEKDGRTANEIYQSFEQIDGNGWCNASLEEVKDNCNKVGLDPNSFEFIKGDVRKTLLIKANLPEKISILRLDTDLYDSTKIEMEILYPLLSRGGSLILDDYGYWAGSAKAVDEYFRDADYTPLMNVVDQFGRSTIKQ